MGKTFKVCFLGGTRYRQPLDTTNAKKFRMLRSLGEVFIIAFSPDLHPRRFTESAHFYLLPRFRPPALRYAEMLILGPVLACWLIFRHGVRILVAQSPHEGFAAALAKKIADCFGRKVVLVVESHGDFEESLFLQRRVLLPRLYRYLMRHAAHFSLKHAACLRAISHATRQQLERWMPGKPIAQFAAWTDIEVFLQAGSDMDRHSLQDILYTGVLIPRKGVHHLINAFAYVAKDFTQARLVIIGHEENKTYAAALRKQAGLLGVDKQIQFVGEMPQGDLAAWMSSAYVFVLPSISEGLGRVVIEAMATGVPVIGSHVGGIPEMIEDGVTGFLLEPCGEAALAERLRWLLGHPDEAYEMGRRARALAERFFSAEAYVQGYRQVFEAAHAVAHRQGEDASPTLQSSN
jgi:glycosyltransferase involved in cell wall biosynthesis